MTQEILVVNGTEQLVVETVTTEVLDTTIPFELIEVAQQGPAGPPGEANIGGYGISISGIAPGDLLEFNGTTWGNTNKAVIVDGGNF